MGGGNGSLSLFPWTPALSTLTRSVLPGPGPGVLVVVGVFVVGVHVFVDVGTDVLVGTPAGVFVGEFVGGI